MAGTIANLVVAVGADTATLKTGMKQAETSVSSFEQTIGKIGKMMAGAFSVTALVAFGKTVVDNAGKIVDLSAKTGLSTDAIQEMQYVANQTGSTLDQFATAAFQLGVRLSGGNASVRDAVDRLGLSFTELQRLKPEDQFAKVVEALGRMQSETDRNALGQVLFGKNFQSIAAAIAEGYLEIASQASKSSEQQLKAVDKAADAWSRFVDSAMTAAASALGNVVLAFERLGEAELNAAIIAQGSAEQFAELTNQQQRTTDIVLKAAPAMQSYHARLAAANAEVSKLTASQKLEIEAATKLGVSMSELSDEFDISEAALKIYATQQHEATKKTQELARASEQAREAEERWRDATSEASAGLTWMLAKLQPMPPAIDNMNASTQVLASSTLDLAASLRMVAVDALPVNQRISETVPVTEKARSAFGSMVDGMKESWAGLLDGLTGGTNSIGGFFSRLGKGIMDGFGQIISSGLASLVNMGVSAAIAGLSKLGGAIKGLFGGGEHGKVNDLRDKFIEAAGGLHELNVKAVAAGTNLHALLAAKTVKDFEAAVADLQAKMGTFADEQAADAARLEEAIRKYGFAFEELGPKFQAQQLHEKATELIEDWRVLVDSGIAVDTVNTKMADSMNAYLQQALTVGAEVPAAMRPILEKMAEQGLLTDSNGNKITDLAAAGVTFSETMTQGFDRVVAKLQELLDRIGMTSSAIQNIPDGHFEVHGELVMPDIPDAITIPINDTEFGGFMASGGRGLVTRPTLFVAGEAGPEEVAFSGANRRLSGGGGSDDGIRAELAQLRRDLPRAIGVAVQDALALAPRRRFA